MRQETRDRRHDQETYNRRYETGERRHEIGDRRHKTEDVRQDILHTWVLVVQSSVARLDLCGMHLDGHHPAGLVPGSFSSNSHDEVSVNSTHNRICPVSKKNV